MKRLQSVFCSLCGHVLTSSRSIRLGIGQRCKWKRDGKPTRTRSSRVSQGMPIDDVDYTESGGKLYQRKLYEAFEE